MTLNWGYLAGSALFLAALVILVICQIVAKRFHPLLYWATIVASTTFGTTMADFADRSLGIGYTGGSLLLFACLVTVLSLWYWSQAPFRCRNFPTIPNWGSGRSATTCRSTCSAGKRLWGPGSARSTAW